MNSSIPSLNLEQRRALLWVRAHQPASMNRLSAGAPTLRTRLELMQAGLIEFDPKRNRFDPVTYTITEAGERALKP